MVIIGVQNTKGGATKSTTSVNLARAYQRAGLKVALGETDSQGTLREWFHDNEGKNDDMPAVIQLSDRDAIIKVRDNPDVAGIDLLIIDGVANGFREFLAVSGVADFIIVVAQPSSADLKPIEELVDILEGRSAQAAFLLTRTRKGDDFVDEARRALTDAYQYPVLKGTIRDLKGFRTTFGAGQTVFEYSDYKRGQDDVVAVAEEIWNEHLTFDEVAHA